MSLEQDIKTVEIEMNLTGAVRDYAMYTELGNAGIHAIVIAAEAGNMTWKQVYGALRKLADSNEHVFGEATDTQVREAVYEALEFGKTNH